MCVLDEIRAKRDEIYAIARRHKAESIDIISAVDGLDYADAARRAVKMDVDGLEIKVVSLDDLIVNKRASGRPKDIADAMALEKLKERKHG